LTRAPYQHLEYQLTLHYVQRHLPPGGIVLDAGGGAGRYTLELCRGGRKVVLCDLAPGNITLARENIAGEPAAVQAQLLDAVVADVRALPFPDSHFSAVLCLGGPLSHLPDPADRAQAVRELVRVAAPGAIVVLTGIGYLAVLRTIMLEFSHELIDGSLATFFTDGNSPGPGGMRWHWFRAPELRELAETHGLTTMEMAGCQGLSTGLEEATNRLRQDEVKWERWFEILLATASEPAVVDMAEHILYVGRKG
ncbi:MAG TPA: class I SAM-dependent methyltransferase, partial [Armatimonadota bacterium]